MVAPDCRCGLRAAIDGRPVAERGTYLRIPYSLTWQSNQSVAPGSALGFRGIFSRLFRSPWHDGGARGLGHARAGVCGRRCGASFAIRDRHDVRHRGLLFAIVAGVHGPFAVPYTWIVRHVPESGVFRELYDLAGIFAALIAVLACAGAGGGQAAALSCARRAAKRLPIDVALRASERSSGFRGTRIRIRRIVGAALYERCALAGVSTATSAGRGGDGADPDAHGYPGGVTAMNEYLPTLSRRRGPRTLRTERRRPAVTRIGRDAHRAAAVADLASNGRIGLAASSLAPPNPLLPRHRSVISARRRRWFPRVTARASSRWEIAGRLRALLRRCGPAVRAIVRAFQAHSDSHRSANRVDRRAARDSPRRRRSRKASEACSPQSALPHPVEPGSALLAYVRGALNDSDRRL